MVADHLNPRVIVVAAAAKQKAADKYVALIRAVTGYEFKRCHIPRHLESLCTKGHIRMGSPRLPLPGVQPPD